MFPDIPADAALVLGNDDKALPKYDRQTEDIRLRAGKRRRRTSHWSVNQKLCMLAQSQAPGWSVLRVCKLNGIVPGTLYNWRKDFSAGNLSNFGPASELTCSTSRSKTADLVAGQSMSDEKIIDIELPSGAKMRIEGRIDETLLRQIGSILK